MTYQFVLKMAVHFYRPCLTWYIIWVLSLALNCNMSHYYVYCDNYPHPKKESTYQLPVYRITGILVSCNMRSGHTAILNPLCANFFRGNINIYLHFSFIHIDMTQVLKIHPEVREGPTYSIKSISWLLMSWQRKEPGHQQPWYWPS